MSSVPAHVARKRSAAVVAAQSAPKVIDGQVVARPLHLWRVAGWIALGAGAVLFAGMLLSMLQHAA